MARRPKGSVPSYRFHKSSGQAVVSLPRGDGTYRDVLLGKFNSQQSKEEYARVIGEWIANGRQVPTVPTNADSDLTIAELILRFWKHAEQHYRDAEGAQTSELACYRLALRPVRQLYSSTLVTSFGPLALKAVRTRMIERGLSRKTINKSVNRIRKCFAWGVEEELVPAAVLHALKAVAGLKKNRTAARETARVLPVTEATIDATLPYLSEVVRAMVQFQRFTGCRPSEVCRLRPCDIDMTGAVWIYKPHRHKTEHHDRERFVHVGPNAQEVVKPYLTLDSTAYIFSPIRAVEEVKAKQRARRQSKIRPSQVDRCSPQPGRQPGAYYKTRQYAQAVDRANERAFPPPEDLARKRIKAKRGETRWETDKEWRIRLGDRWPELLAWRKANHWNLNQLRHAYLTAVRRQYGAEAAQVIAGHAELRTTEIYAERNMGLAAEVAAAMG